MSAHGWGLATLALYALARALYARRPRTWLSPLLLVPALLVVAVRAAHVPYQAYLDGGGGWLVWLLGPATVAFAVPLYEHRALVRRHGPELAAGVVVGSLAAVGTTWGLAALLGLGSELTRSMLPRSVTTPLAMLVAEALGGSPTLAAVCVIVTALVGLAIGPHLARPLRSAVARGALLGMGAHGAGTARAMEMGPLEGTFSALVMVLAGLLLFACSPLLRWALGG